MNAPALIRLFSCLCALMLFLARHNQPPLVISHIWLHVGSHSFEASLALSNQSLLMLVVVSVISLLVHIYSNVYMGGDPDWKKYFAMLGFSHAQLPQFLFNVAMAALLVAAKMPELL